MPAKELSPEQREEAERLRAKFDAYQEREREAGREWTQTATTTFVGNQAFTNVNGMPGMMIPQSCTVNWTINSAGRIETWRWEGNACKAR